MQSSNLEKNEKTTEDQTAETKTLSNLRPHTNSLSETENSFENLHIIESQTFRRIRTESEELGDSYVFEETPIFLDNDVKRDCSHDSDINFGYDIISEYSSSVEDAACLIPQNREILTHEVNDKNESPVVLNISDISNSFEDSTYMKPNAGLDVCEGTVSPSAPENLESRNQTEVMDPLFKNEITYPDLVSQIAKNMADCKENNEKLIPFTEAEMSSVYYNQELHNHSPFVNNFIEVELRSGNVVNHPLHELLVEYLTRRDNLCKNKLEFSHLIENYQQFQDQIWNLDTSSITEYGECQDGNPVAATHHFKVAHFNQYIFEKFGRTVELLGIFVTESYINNIFNVEFLQLKIQHFIDSLCYHFNYLNPPYPIPLHSESVPRGPFGADYRHIINHMKSAISVLFSFQRRPTKDDSFIEETRKWLEKLISVLLRVATANDHLFIIHHIMRCPAGVGKWASHYIQPPVPNNGSLYNQQYLDHLITTLAIILLPVENRNSFLEQMEAGLEENGMWVIIDSDGEDSDDNPIPKTALKENDLVSFLNQIPFADIFRQILLVSRDDKGNIYNVNTATDRDVLRSIAISTLLVNLLEQGIAHYSQPAYKQFCKRLSRLIKHTASYVSDYWEMFRETYTQRSIVDSAMLNRLQVEYDEFLMRVVHSLYTTHDRISWQYLATLPFGMITTQTLWRSYQYLLHTNANDNVLMSEEFMENLVQLPDNDIYYFLTTISNMALSRPVQDWLFIQTMTLQLFRIGFINSAVRDKCTKSARILIANLTSKHPSLISDLILALKKDFIFVGKLSVYLFKDLPISLWKPNHADTLTISDWLLNYSLTSWESNLSRYILSQLNWGYDINEMDLFLSRDFHCETAVTVVKAIGVYTDETTTSGSAAIISQGMRQVSSIVRSTTPEQALHAWAWQILSKLKLHLLDQPLRHVRMALTDFRIAAQIPDINADTENMRTLYEGMARNLSVAYYVAVLTSNVGHSLPLICETCWDYCDVLLSDNKFSEVLHILQLTLPYFLDSVDTLLKFEKFKSVLVKLLNADQTYMKIKSFSFTDSSRPVLFHFAALIQYHIENFSRYCLHNANQMVELWMRILSIIWNEDSYSVSFLMDKILSNVLDDESLKQLAVKILSEIIQNTPNDRYSVGGSLSSLVNWIGYGGNPETVPVRASLLPRSSTTFTHAPYFAFFALHLEEYFTQTETQLWSEILKLLSMTPGKANIDNAVRKACVNLKLVPFTSNFLAIYRWSQYALELPADHPILPLFWQRFFRLYLHRIGSSNSMSVGGKFFEGAVNGNYFKRIRKKLQDCVSCLTNKSADNEFEKTFYFSVASLYKTFLLWSGEARLLEADIFLPGLSAAFNTTKLSEILNGDETPWLEYVDFDNIRCEQKALIQRWIQMLHRESRTMTNRIICFPEDHNVLASITGRLQSYDERLPPPELKVSRSIVPELSRDLLLNKHLLQESLGEHFQILAHYTRSHEIEKAEQKTAATKLLDAFQRLYTEVNTEEKLFAACDTVSPLLKRRTVSAIHCAGPATIIIQFRESKLNKGAKYTIETCDIDFQRLLRLNLKSPPMQFIVACIFIELAADTLRNERAEVKAVGDIAILNTLQDVGVTLFYNLISSYDSSVSEYFPTKLFLRKSIEILGQSFINEVESECPRLLNTILNNPKLGSLLVPHFNPAIVSANTFVNLYRKVTAALSTKNVDFVMDLVSKFDVRKWLQRKNSKYADRSQLIEVVALALKEIGSQPAEALLPISTFFCRDFCEILAHDFPEHYGEILHVLLRFSAEEKFSCAIWYDVLICLCNCVSKNSYVDTSQRTIRPGLSVIEIRDIARKYASELRTLTFQELNETVNILGSNFLKERLQYGLYGLYPKYDTYMEPIIILHSLVGHAVVASILHVQRGALADRICEKTWPILVNLFSPWIIPYYTGNLHEPPAAWIQKLTDDRSVLLPWTPGEVAVANKMMATFTECLKFILDALPASNVILSSVCQWYITQYARESVKEHILTVVQNNLITLYWSRYIPNLVDLELMLKVIDQYLPVCHSFLGSIFIEIPWKVVVQYDSPQASSRLHVILLNLLIKLANEPNLRQSGKVSTLLVEAQRFQWHLVDATNYEYVLNWFVMGYDPRVIVQSCDDDWNGIDMAAFELLQVAAGYVSENGNLHATTLRKRQLFVKACVKLALQWAHRYKNVLIRHHSQMEAALTRMLDKMESVVSSTVVVENQASECSVLLSELLVLVNQPSASILPKLMIQVLTNWLSHRGVNSPVLSGLIRIAGSDINEPLHVGIILEACLTAWFTNSDGTEDCDWKKVLSMLNLTTVYHSPIENIFIENNQILSLFAFAMKQIESDAGVLMYSKIIRWIKSIKPSNENESKLPLLWSLSFNNYGQDASETRSALLNLCAYFQQITSMKPGWALFGVIGMNKQPVPSLRCKILCHAVNSFILVKLNEEHSESAAETDLKETEAKNASLAKAESMKSVSSLESLLGDKHFAEYRVTIESAIRYIKTKEFSISKGNEFIMMLARQLYTDGFIHAFQNNNTEAESI